MIPTAALRTIARARLRDANVLLRGGRGDAAVYLCGYVVEIALKARICRALNWDGFPETATEFSGLGSLKTHNLALLLRLAGAEERIKRRFGSEWASVLDWDPEKRYQIVGGISAARARTVVAAATILLRAI